MKDLCSLHQLAFDLGVPREWLRKEADAGRVPCLKIGDRYLFARAAVEAAIARNASTATTKTPWSERSTRGIRAGRRRQSRDLG